MSTFTDAILMVGLPYKQLIKSNIEEIDQLLDRNILEVGSFYFDSPRSDNVVGFVIQSTNGFEQVRLESVAALFKEKNTKFFELTGQFGNLYLTTSVILSLNSERHNYNYE